MSLLNFLFIFTKILYASNSELSIGLIIDLNTNKQVHRETLLGVLAGLEKINSGGSNAKVYLYNSKSSAAGTYEASKRSIKMNHDYYIVEIDSSRSKVGSEVFESSKKIMLTPFATSPLVTKNKSYVYRTCFSDKIQGTKLAQIAKNKLNAKNIAIIYDPSLLYSNTLRAEFINGFNENEKKLLRTYQVLSKGSNYQDILNKISKSKTDLIFMPLYEETVVKILKDAQIPPALSKTSILGGDGWSAGRLFRTVMSSSPGIKVYWTDHYDEHLKSDPNKDFRKIFKSIHGILPQTAASALAYDTILLIDKANRLGKRKDLKGITIEGASGKIQFFNDQSPQKTMYLKTIKNQIVVTEDFI